MLLNPAVFRTVYIKGWNKSREETDAESTAGADEAS